MRRPWGESLFNVSCNFPFYDKQNKLKNICFVTACNIFMLWKIYGDWKRVVYKAGPSLKSFSSLSDK